MLAGYTPTHFEFYDEEKQLADPKDMNDSIASIVMQRFRDSRQSKTNNRVYQNKSTIRLHREADYALEKRYTPEQEQTLTHAFGFCPTRYYGLSAAKTVAIANWKSELVAGDPGALVKIIPTPDPRLPRASVLKIKEAVKYELIKRMVDNGVGDPRMLLSVANGRLHESVKRFLDDKAMALREIEKAKITAAALSAADRIQIKMRDVVVEGSFREAYASFSHDQLKYGIGIIRFPHWQRRVILADNQDFKGKPERKWSVVPTFAHVSPWNFFPTNDGRSVIDCTAVMEYREVNKAQLVNMTRDPRYNKEEILAILDKYSMRARTWLFPESADTISENGETSRYWGPEELVAVIHHEGYVTGYDLHKFGLTGYEDTEIYNIRAEICCGHTILIEVKDPTKTLPRSYATTKFDEQGPGIWNTIGVPAILQDTQDRVNVMLHCIENNIDWTLRPPLMTNPEALNNPADASRIMPGGKYQISDMLAPGQVPDPIRAIRGPTAQYQIAWPIVLQMIRQADTEIGVPDLADMNTFGRGSLGELSARVSQAVRRVRNAAFSEDTSMKVIWQVLFEYVLEENPALIENADLSMNYVGVVGLLAQEQERKAKMERLQLAVQATQAGGAPPEVAKFAYQDILKDYGLPTEALGYGDPLVDNAIAIAMQGGPTAAGAGGGIPQVPKLDGRSGAISAIPTAIAQPNGASAIAPPVGMA